MVPSQFAALFVVCLFSSFHADAYKVLIFVPSLSNSQVILNIRVGDLLAQAGHDVVLYRAQYDPSTTKLKAKYAREIFAPAADPVEYEQAHARHRVTAFRDLSLIGRENREMIGGFIAMLKRACEVQATNRALLEQLHAEKFDIAISHMYDMCPLGLIHLLEIPTYIWMSSGVLIESMASLSGTPSPPSYVPATVTGHSDKMTYKERLVNFFAMAVFNALTQNFYGLVEGPSEMFRRHYGADFPDLVDVAAKSQLIFVNSEELLDFPRPILHKVVYMGALGIKDAKPLPHDWQKLMDEARDGVVLLSFGSVVKSAEMPQEWRVAFLNSFAKFPTYTFIWKFEDALPEAKRVKNVVITPWLPQNDLFGHPKMRLFMTHCGYNSLIETAYAGIPTIAIPLFGDQFRNARVAQRHNLTVVINKPEFSETTVTNAIREILSDHSYAMRAKRMSKMLRKKPVKSEQLVVKWVEFLAEFQTLPLDVVGAQLNFIQYFSLDVIATYIAGTMVTLYLIVKLFGCCCRLLLLPFRRQRKPKKD